jgi:SAM-dependent methyltransferase
VSPEDFEPRFLAAEDSDPWAFASSAYEQRRYDLAVGLLDRPRYRRVFEPGCAVGELTRRLADRADAVVGLEPSTTALAVARRRTAGVPGVTLTRGAVPEDWPDGTFDLVVLSEIGYYFDRDELAALVRRAHRSAAPDGQLLAVHWRGDSEDHLLHGDVVHEVVASTLGAGPAVELVDPGFVAARWELP